MYKVKLGKRANFIENENNNLSQQGFKSTSKFIVPIRAKDKSYDKSKMVSIVQSIFSDKRLKQLSKEKTEIQMLCLLDAHGNVLEISFSIPSNASLSPIEVEELEEKVKRDFTFNLNYEVFKNYNFYPLSIWVDFYKLYNKESDAIYP